MPSNRASPASRAVSACLHLATHSLPASKITLRASLTSFSTSSSVKPSFFCLDRADKSATTRSNGCNRRHSCLYPLTRSRKGIQRAWVKVSSVSVPCLRARLRAFLLVLMKSVCKQCVRLMRLSNVSCFLWPQRINHPKSKKQISNISKLNSHIGFDSLCFSSRLAHEFCRSFDDRKSSQTTSIRFFFLFLGNSLVALVLLAASLFTSSFGRK